MKTHIQKLVETAIAQLQQEKIIPLDSSYNFQVERTKDKLHGDFAVNAALVLAKTAGKKPRELAELLQQHIPGSEKIGKVEIAGPGFLNFFLSPHAFHSVIADILNSGQDYGRSDIGHNKRIHIEMVSANPTGPLHVGHGRLAAYGASVADLLEAVGFSIHREYYVNDAGRQMNILALSVLLRYLALCGETIIFPSNGYRGEYIIDIAHAFKQSLTKALTCDVQKLYQNLPPDEDAEGNGDKEAHVDALIANARALIGEQQFQTVLSYALNDIRDGICEDLADFGVHYNEWFSERSLTTDGAVTTAIQELTDLGHTYKQDGALWFAATKFGDEKDRVLVRENGHTTYFASDVAYHLNKFARGFHQTIDILGADHHGYVPRIKAVLEAAGHSSDKFNALLIQFAILYRGTERVQMSTRSGSFVTLRDLYEEVGKDAARFFYVMRRREQHLDFDLELAKSQSNENPVYYIQYAHARVCSVMRQMHDKGMHWDQKQGLQSLSLLNETHENALINQLARFPEVVQTAALDFEPHLLAHFLRDLANDFHTYYNAHQFLVEDVALREARLALISATRQVLANGLTLLGLSAPEKM